MTKDKKYMYVGIGLLLVTLILSGVTYAVLTWTSTKTNIGINTDCFTIDYTKGNNITGKLKLLNESDLISEDNKLTIKEGLGISGVNIGINSTCNIEGYGSIYLNITNISDVFTTGDSKGALKYAVLKNTSTITDLASINTASLNGQSFEIVTNGSITSSDKKLLYKTELSNTEISKYIVVIYVDNALVGNDALSGTLKGNISAEAEQARYGETPDYCFSLSNKDEANKTASIGSYNCYEGNTGSYETITDVVIPEEIDGYTIDTIAQAALGIKNITSVVLPNTITTIKTMAFFRNKLVSINIPESVTSIEDNAFSDNKLTSIKIPSTVTKIKGSAFYQNPLTSIIVDPNNTIYDSRDNCNAIIETSTNTLIQGSQNTIIPSTVTALGNYSLSKMDLIDITIPDSMTSIGEFALSHNQLTSITIPDSVTTIESYAFSDNQLTSIIIPSSITKINFAVFSRNPLTNIIVDPNNTIYDSRDDCNAIIETSTNTLITGCKNTIIPSSVTEIVQLAFYGSNLTSITIPNSVTAIGSSAFEENQLTTINIPDSITAINRRTFDANRLTSITIPDSVTTIGYSAFSYNGLTNITIPDSITTIGGFAFAYNNLNNIHIGNGSKLSRIDSSTFSSSSRTFENKNNGITYVDNPNLKKIYYNGNNSLTWINAINGSNSSSKFVTGTVPSYTEGVTTYNEVLITTGTPNE